MKNRNKNNDMKKGFQWMALLVVAMLGACSGGSDLSLIHIYYLGLENFSMEQVLEARM